MIKGIERVTPMLKFELRGVEVRLSAERRDSPPRILRVDYELVVDTDEDDGRQAMTGSEALLGPRGIRAKISLSPMDIPDLIEVNAKGLWS